MKYADLVHRRTVRIVVFVFFGYFLFSSTTNAQEHWVTTWATAPTAPFQARPGMQLPPADQQALGGFNNQTLRMIVHTSIGGKRVRIRLSNAFGTTPLTVSSAHLGLRAKESAIQPGSDRVLLFGGKPSFSIPPGAMVISDPVDLDVPALGDLSVSLYFSRETGPPTMHSVGLHTTYISKQGDSSGELALSDVATTQSYYFLSGVDVLASLDSASLVAFGDSITDGARSTPEADRSWPSILAKRLLSGASPVNLAVLNEGISGNRLLRDGAGINALARFDRDVLSQAGVRWLVVLEGINDIGLGTRANAAATEAVTADDLIGALKQLIERAHAHGIKVIGATLTPYSGAGYYSEAGEAVREAVNRWIRTGGAYDAVFDFEAAVRDSNTPKQIRTEFDPGDHLHPNDAGYKSMADSIELSILAQKSGSTPTKEH